jgi:hypothetical protein
MPIYWPLSSYFTNSLSLLELNLILLVVIAFTRKPAQRVYLVLIPNRRYLIAIRILLSIISLKSFI